MADKIHLNSFFGATLCGMKYRNPNRFSIFPFLAKKYSEVTCKRCMKTENYKKYLAGKFREKPANG